MKIALVFAALVAATLAAPPVQILQQHDNRDDRGQFAMSYLSADGTRVAQQGVLIPTDDGTDYVLVYNGEYQYTSPDGTPIHLTYKADKNGFQPTGAHLPVAPVA